MSFVNLIESFSKSDDDLINILDRANQYIREPLYGIINEFVMDVRLYASPDESFEKLLNQLKNTKYEDVFICLWICSRHDSNYHEVIRDIKVSVKEYIKSKENQKAIKDSAKIDIIALLVAGFYVVNILNGFLGESVYNILFSGVAGVLISIYCLIVSIVAVLLIFGR